MFEMLGDRVAVALIGVLGGLLLGLAARLGRFCTLGAIEDLLYGRDDTRFRMWILAIGVAVLGTYALVATGLLNPAQTVYLSAAWSPMASVLGGLTFGYGMALAGNCGYGALARLGGGDLRSFVIVLVMGLAAYATVSGPLAWVRVAVFPVSPAGADLPGMAQGLEQVTGVAAPVIGMGFGAVLIGLSLLGGSLRTRPAAMFWSVIVAAAILSGWAGTQWVARHGFDGVPVVSHTFSAPLGETMLYAMTATGRSLSFGVGSVLGVLAGAFAGSLIKGHFRWEACEDPRELRRQIVGAALMGVGAVVAVGCSIGQGLSAFSLLAYSAPVTFLAIMIGAAIGLRQLIVGFQPAE